MHKSTTSKRKLPDTWLVVFFILVVIAILTWIVPSGSFDYETIDIDGAARKVAIAGSYQEISKAEVSATGLLGLFASLYEGCVSAADIIFVIMTCAATFGVIVKTGAFHAFIGRVVQKNGSRSLILIPVLMLVFGLGGSLFGMLSEFYGFYPLIVGLMMALGYDAMTGFATIALGEYIGFMAATLNPYTVAVAQSIAGVQLYSGIGYRAVCFVVLMGAAVAYLMLYARKVRRKPELSVVYGDSCTHSFERSQLDSYTFTWRHTLILLDVLATLVILMLGMIRWKWGYKELCGLFIIMSAVAALIDKWSPNDYCQERCVGLHSDRPCQGHHCHYESRADHGHHHLCTWKSSGKSALCNFSTAHAGGAHVDQLPDPVWIRSGRRYHAYHGAIGRRAGRQSSGGLPDVPIRRWFEQPVMANLRYCDHLRAG